MAKSASSAYFGSHLGHLFTHFCFAPCAAGLPASAGASLAGGQDGCPVAHRRLRPVDVQLAALARGHAEVVAIAYADLDALRGVDGCLVRHVVVSVSLGHL